MDVNLFNAQAKTLDISVTAAASTSQALPNQGNNVRIVNEGPNIAFVSIGAAVQVATLPSAVTPVATCTPVPVGDITLSIPAGAVQNISAICRASQTARLSVQVGEGM